MCYFSLISFKIAFHFCISVVLIGVTLLKFYFAWGLQSVCNRKIMFFHTFGKICPNFSFSFNSTYLKHLTLLHKSLEFLLFFKSFFSSSWHYVVFYQFIFKINPFFCLLLFLLLSLTSIFFSLCQILQFSVLEFLLFTAVDFSNYIH